MALNVEQYQRSFHPRISDLLPLDLIHGVMRGFLLSTERGIAFLMRTEELAQTGGHSQDELFGALAFSGDEMGKLQNRVCQTYLEGTSNRREGCRLSDQAIFEECCRNPSTQVRTFPCWLGFDEYAHGITVDGKVRAVLISGQRAPDDKSSGEKVARKIWQNVHDHGLAERMVAALPDEVTRQRQLRLPEDAIRAQLQGVTDTLQQLTNRLIVAHRSEAYSKLVAELSDHLAQAIQHEPSEFSARCEEVFGDFCRISGLERIVALARREGRYRAFSTRQLDSPQLGVRSGEVISAVPMGILKTVEHSGSAPKDNALRSSLENVLVQCGVETTRAAEESVRLYRHDTRCPDPLYSPNREGVFSTLLVLVGNCHAAFEPALEELCRTVSVRLAVAGLVTRLSEAQSSYVEHVRKVGHSIRTPLQCNRFDLAEFRPILASHPELIERLEESEARLFDAYEDLTYLVQASQARRQRFDLIALLEQLVRKLAPFSEHYNAPIVRWNEWPKEVLVEGDRAAIRRGLQAILENGVKFSFREKDVRVQVMTTEGSVRVVVSNYGIGIPEETISELLDGVVGTRAQISDDNTWGRSREGTGTGVSTALSAFRNEGGDVEIKSHQRARGAEQKFHRWVTDVAASLPLPPR